MVLNSNVPVMRDGIVKIVNTQKIAISMPADLVAMIDTISKQKGMFKSRFISTVLHEKILMDEVHEGLKIVTGMP